MLDFKKYPEQDVFNYALFRSAHLSEKYEFPILNRNDYIPKGMISFDRIKKGEQYDKWLHFYIYDYKFECIWDKPKDYVALFFDFEGIITPDFSMYRSLPIAFQIWNTFRNRAVGWFAQSKGLKILRNVTWSDELCYDFVFEGLEEGGSFAVSTNGYIQDKADRWYFEEGLKEMVKRLKPDRLIVYSQMPENIFGKYREQGIELINIPHWRLEKR